MRREKKRVIISFALTACMVFTTEFGSLAADTQSDAQPIETINHETTISPLAETWNEIPETAAVAEATQVWHGKALANVESEADVLAEAVDGGEVVGKMYTNTILTVEERGDVWSKVSSGSVVGYVKNEMLAFGSDAVARAAAIDMTNPQDAKTLEEIAAEEAAKKAAEEKAKNDREMYKQMVDEEIANSIPVLLGISEQIKASKQTVMDNFKIILEMKADLFKTKVKDDQRSHTFTNSEGDKRITLGVYVTDGYRDTVEDGIAIVKEYIEGLAKDEKTKALVSMVLRLLARDAKGTLKASRIVQLRKVAMETGDDRFIEGVRIIEEAYQPEVSKQFIRAEIKNENGMWKPIPLGMTES